MHRARKRFGQNFLQDEGIIYSIVSFINPSADMRVMEIGPGLGALTRPLLRNLDQLDLLEIDRDLVAYWKQQNLAGLTVIEGDALQFDFLEWAQRRINLCDWNHLVNFLILVFDFSFISISPI